MKRDRNRAYHCRPPTPLTPQLPPDPTADPRGARRQPQHLPGETLARQLARAGRDRLARPGPAVRRPQARGHAAPLGPAHRDGRRAPLVGRPEGAVVRHERQAPRREGRGPPARVRRLRGDHPVRELRRRRDHRLGPRRVGAARGLARGTREGKAPVRAQGLQAPRQVDAREDQEEREGLAPDQGARRLRQVSRATCSPRSRCCRGSPSRR